MADIVTLKDLPSSFGEHFLTYICSLRQRIQARSFATESYIQNIRFYREIDGLISARGAGIFHSQKKSESLHTINISDDSKVTDAHCTCKAGVSEECAHVLAIIITLTDWILESLKEIPSQPACTFRPQQWGRPRGTKIISEPVATIVLSRPDNVNRKKRPITIPCIQPNQEPAAGGTSCGNLDFPTVPDIENLEILNDYRNLFDSVQISQKEAITLEKKHERPF